MRPNFCDTTLSYKIHCSVMQSVDCVLLFAIFIHSFLRSVSYREFSRLIYGFLGNKRIPLPACAYTAIRKSFPCTKGEDFTRFDLGEED